MDYEQALNSIAYSLPRVSTWEEQPVLLSAVNWLAQCARRMWHPLDASERSGLPAFEYAWKAFNALYKDYPGSKESDRVKACLRQRLVNPDEFFASMTPVIEELCGDLLSLRPDDPDVPLERRKMVARVGEYALELQRCLQQHDTMASLEGLADLLYGLRNARVHGDFYIASSVSRASDRELITVPLHFRRLPEITFAMCIWLLDGKLFVKHSAFGDWIVFLEDALRFEIVRTVEQWLGETPPNKDILH